jgi:hypothetical protein
MNYGDAYPRTCEIWINEELGVRICAHGIAVFVGSNPDRSLAWDIQITKVEMYIHDRGPIPMTADKITSVFRTKIERALLSNY